MQRRNIFSVAALSFAFAVGSMFVTINVAYAYPIAGSTAGTNGGTAGTTGAPPSAVLPTIPAINTFNFNSLIVPFQNFIQSFEGSANSIKTPSIPGSFNMPPSVSIPAVPQGSFTNMIQNWFQQFDAWLYGIAGFHISGLFVAILSILSWLLGIVKGAVDWLLGVLHV